MSRSRTTRVRGTASRRRPPAAVALLLALLATSGSAAPRSEPPDTPVVLIIVDTLRADHLGCYGYPLDTSPVLDAFAERACLFEANATQCNATFASITSIFTGLYPRTHSNYQPVPLEGQADANDGLRSVAERLSDVGYRTLAAVSHTFWTERPRSLAMGRGWDAFSVIPAEASAAERRGTLGAADATNERAFALLDEHLSADDDAPLFLWLHYFDPHTPYDPPAALRNAFLEPHLERIGRGSLAAELAPLPPEQRLEWIRELDDDDGELRLANARALYDGEIRHVDAQIGVLFQELRRRGLFDPALIVVMADHGENLEDAAWGHGRINFTHKGLYEGVARTPLLVKLPGQHTARRTRQLTQNIDVLPTILELLGLPQEPDLEGRSLLPLIAEPHAPLHEQVFTESSDGIETALKTRDLKYIDGGLGGSTRLFRWRVDPLETRDVLAMAPEEIRQQMAWLTTRFRPSQELRVALMPDAQPWDISLRATFEDARPQGLALEGADGSPVDGRVWGRSFAWSGRVEDVPVTLVLTLDRRPEEMVWHVERSDGRAVTEAVHVGDLPLAESSATPLWEPLETSAPDAPVRVDTEADGRELVVSIAPGIAQEVVVELGFAADAGPDDLTLVDAKGFGQLRHPRSRGALLYRLEADANDGARARLRAPTPLDATGVAVLLDGRWVTPRQLALDGRAVATHRFGFRLSREWRMRQTLGTAPLLEHAPPGALIIWLEQDHGTTSLDVSGLDDEQLAELRALGYVK